MNTTQHSTMMKNSKGFTLIELLIVVAIISIIMGIGLPSFQSIITDTRLTSTANTMLSAYQLARSEAIKQHKDVYVTTADNWTTWQVTVKDATAPIATFSKSTNIDITKAGDVTGYTANGLPSPRSVSCDAANTSSPPTCGFTFANADGSNTRTLNIGISGKLKVTNP